MNFELYIISLQMMSAHSSKQGTLKEESSDESSIISSQTSTLTRNIGPEAMFAQAPLPVLAHEIKVKIQYFGTEGMYSILMRICLLSRNLMKKMKTMMKL